MKTLKVMMMALMMCLVGIGYAQIDTLKYDKHQDSNYYSKFEKKNTVNHILFKDGTTLSIGDKLKIGNPSSTNLSSQQSSGIMGGTSRVSNTFSYLMSGRMGFAVMAGVNFLPETFKGRSYEIVEIKYNVYKNRDMTAIMMILKAKGTLDITVIDFKSAIEFGEVINLKRGMTSSEALELLKEAKTKLDLELISQEKYDSIKIELSKLIK
jgi:hypothetical protein